MFKKMFGASKASSPKPGVATRVPNKTLETLAELEKAQELLERRRAVLEKKINAELVRAKELLRAGNKAGAGNALKKRKLYEKQAEQLDNQINTITAQLVALEGTQSTSVTVGALKVAAGAGKAAASQMRVEDVDNVMADLNELAADQAAVNDALSAPTGAAALIDEDDIAAELEDLEASELDAQLLEPAAVPTGVPARAQATHSQAARPAAAAAAPSGKTAEDLEFEEFQATLA